MTYQATVYNVMIASPSDVIPERSIAREVLAEWNAVNANRRRIVLMPVTWESHSSPEMGDRAQAIINSRVLNDCDLLIGIFWTRLGTPTGEFDSGTVEEIEEHINAGRPAMLYFSSVPVQLDSVDQQQYAALEAFRNQAKERGLYETYSDLNEFRSKLYKHVQLMANRHEIFAEEAHEKELGGSETVEELQKPAVPTLSKEAKHLLTEAAKDPHGHILHLRHLGGTTIQVNNQSVVQTGERRMLALWESAISELVTHGLIEAVGYKGEIYEMTRWGYEVADQLSD